MSNNKNYSQFGMTNQKDKNINNDFQRKTQDEKNSTEKRRQDLINLYKIEEMNRQKNDKKTFSKL
jgi:hypothetical protein